VEDLQSQNLNHLMEHQNQHSVSGPNPGLDLSHRWHFDLEVEIHQQGWVERIGQQHSGLRIENHPGYLVAAKRS